MSLSSLVLENLWAKKFRSFGISLAVALAVMTVVSLVSVSSGLESSAAAVLGMSRADFTVAQKGVSNIFYSDIDNGQLNSIRSTGGVQKAVGVLLETQHLNAANPLFLEIGIPPSDVSAFGAKVTEGRPYSGSATHEVMLGWRAAKNLGLKIGARMYLNGTWNTVVGIYDTGIPFDDLGSMFPILALQSYNRVPGAMTLVFVNVDRGVSASAIANALDSTQPELTTIRTSSQFSSADRNLVFLRAATTGSTILAILIGAIVVGNTMLLSLFERTREFGLLRSIGWARARLIGLVVGEGLVLAVIGSAVGVILSFIATALLQALPQLTGVLHVNFTEGAFWRGLYTGLGMALLGALYPAVRAANLTPLKALSHE